MRWPHKPVYHDKILMWYLSHLCFQFFGYDGFNFRLFCWKVENIRLFFIVNSIREFTLMRLLLSARYVRCTLFEFFAVIILFITLLYRLLRHLSSVQMMYGSWLNVLTKYPCGLISLWHISHTTFCESCFLE